MISVTPELLQRYDRPGPRYTSYPPVPFWNEAFGADDYGAALRRAASDHDAPLSLYVHIPFCHHRCAFCGCNAIVSRKEGVADEYLDYLGREIALVRSALGERQRVRQLHLGGGTPTFLSPAQLTRLHGLIADAFTIEPEAEVALEADPRITTAEQVACLRGLGFNRLSMGVQDLDAAVQEAIGRGQTVAETTDLYEASRAAGFASISMDLVYGLPGQGMDTWRQTLDTVIAMRPDRLAIYSYAHLPDSLRNQRKIDPALLPDAQAKYALFAHAREQLLEAGYAAIGMDHFALPEDELAVALSKGRLRRNFMGYTVVQALDSIGLGTSGIGEIGGAFAQNEKKLSRYYSALDAGQFATMLGYETTPDDRMRAWIIRELTCGFRLDFEALRARFGAAYPGDFAEEEADLAPYYEDGFLERNAEGLRVLPLGQVFVRNLAMVFDAHLRQKRVAAKFSRTV